MTTLATPLQLRRSAERIGELAGRGLDVGAFWRACGEVLATTVPHHLGPCWYTFDPASLLITSHYDPVIVEIPAEFLAHEYYDDDVLKMVDVARSSRGISTLHEATGGDPSKSPAWRDFIVPYGGDQQLLLSLRSRPSDVWGMLALYRNSEQPPFTPAEIAFLGGVAGSLAEGARRGLLIGEANEPDLPEGPSLIVLDEDWHVQSMTPSAEDILTALPGGDSWLSRGTLPSCVLSVAGHALRSLETAHTPGEVAVARVRSRGGQWLTVHGAPLLRDGSRRVAVIIERADPDRISPLLMDVYALTDREKEIARLVLRGEDTAGIAASLVVSPHTVQQHLKNIFAKTGVHSRRELAGKVFFRHYEPRLRDNERRAHAGRAMLSGPVIPPQLSTSPESPGGQSH